ncbi:MAG: MFS transporter [Lentisphaerae bacterium]|nr:MFS transporter [Lentisphaerota bacterium]
MNAQRRQIWGWAFYDWANSAFATTVMAGFFPVFFAEYWNHGVDASVVTFRLGAAHSIEGILVAALAPLLGAMADRGGARKRFLLAFAALGVCSTAAFFWVPRGAWFAAATLFVLAASAFAASLIFYDALLVGVAREGDVDRVSALGYGLGYLGGGALFTLNVAMTLKPQAFGLVDAGQAVRLSFLTVAVWWALFSLPLWRWVPEPNQPSPQRGWMVLVGGLRQIRATFHEIRRLKVVFLFLLGYWLYIDGVDTIIRMAVNYGQSIGLASKDLILALLITQFVGFPAAIIFGRIGGRLGAKRGILIGLGVYLCATVWGYFMRRPAEFYGLAVVIGCVQGGVQSLSRSLYTRLIPPDKAAEFFGFYNMLGKFAAVIGPLLMGGVSMLTGSARLSILSLSALFIGGGVLLCFVNETPGVRASQGEA